MLNLTKDAQVKCVHLDKSASLQLADAAEIKNNTVVPRRMKVFSFSWVRTYFIGGFVDCWRIAYSQILFRKNVESIFLSFCPPDAEIELTQNNLLMLRGELLEGFYFLSVFFSFSHCCKHSIFIFRSTWRECWDWPFCLTPAWHVRPRLELLPTQQGKTEKKITIFILSSTSRQGVASKNIVRAHLVNT